MSIHGAANHRGERGKGFSFRLSSSLLLLWKQLFRDVKVPRLTPFLRRNYEDIIFSALLLFPLRRFLLLGFLSSCPSGSLLLTSIHLLLLYSLVHAESHVSQPSRLPLIKQMIVLSYGFCLLGDQRDFQFQPLALAQGKAFDEGR